MKHFKSIAAILAASLALLVSACSGSKSTADSVAEAEAAVSEQQFGRAKQLADSLTSSRQIQQLNADQLCRLSLVYMQVSEQLDQEQNVASAALCLRQAITLDPKGVDEIMGNLTPDNQALISTAQQLAQSDTTAKYGEFEGEMHGEAIDYGPDMQPQTDHRH